MRLSKRFSALGRPATQLQSPSSFTPFFGPPSNEVPSPHQIAMPPEMKPESDLGAKSVSITIGVGDEGEATLRVAAPAAITPREEGNEEPRTSDVDEELNPNFERAGSSSLTKVVMPKKMNEPDSRSGKSVLLE
eukprot:Gregarina_sp_Poly_1__2507@NODE_167_length_12139_cov_61_777005_g148_i0_p10_GENE_NODE_167_length_12139_cov_61_777005_g148_i0NODE_167_length_12139_cov_61_777005_g148_i0_p10_ORF_typecomplete_len134_score29_05_NODE_167_length_12139_cov_61_777005_g148_i030023403